MRRRMRLGATHIRVLRGVEDGKAFAVGQNNTTTSADLAVLLERIERGEALKPESVRLMKEVLLRQEFNDEIPAGVPEGDTWLPIRRSSITATLARRGHCLSTGPGTVCARGVDAQHSSTKRWRSQLDRGHLRGWCGRGYRRRSPMKVAFASDHAGMAAAGSFRVFAEAVKALGHELVDVGSPEMVPGDDYPGRCVLARSQRAITSEPAPSEGCWSAGAGVGCGDRGPTRSMGSIRACMCQRAPSRRGRGSEDDDMNCSLPGRSRVIGEELAADLVKDFLGATFSGAERHRRRVEKIAALERAALRAKARRESSLLAGCKRTAVALHIDGEGAVAPTSPP